MDDIWKARRRPKIPPVEADEVRHEVPIFDFELLEDIAAPRDNGGLELGPDLVLFFGNKIVVCSPKQMYAWEAKNFERPKIMFQEQPFYLTRRFPGDEERPYRYELAQWPDYLKEDPKYVFTYDEDYVRQRNGRFKRVKSQSGKISRLTFLYPFLGFLWSGIKENYLEPHGFNPLRITLCSCLLAYAIFMAELIGFFFFATGVLQWWIGNNMLGLDYAFVLVLPVDAAVRFFQIVNGMDRYPAGFLEWTLPFLRRNRAERARIAKEEE